MGPVQVCWHKFCRYFDVEIREVPMEGDRLLLTPEEVLKRCDENTIGVVATLGVTFTLQFEPVHEISIALDKLHARPGSTFPSTSMEPAAHSSRRSSNLTCCGTSACRESSPSMPRDTNSGLRRWAWVGRSGARSTTCPKS